ncbi:transcriptional regulator, LysR family protein [Brucella pseudogrignonensis]|uniref:Transcriptional regulator, LysR family protein n=1 Tax=Brucella pseudogrignonensis TaxID=419475 RepID=A0A256G8W6_9HYPH|nr:transcriptional regulator, LysR family protein [Brucella pseudogrignonensis]
MVLIEPTGRLIVQSGGATNLEIEASKAGLGILCLFEDWLTADFQTGALSSIMEHWWVRFSGLFSIIPGGVWCPRRCVPSLFVRAMPQTVSPQHPGRQTGG